MSLVIRTSVPGGIRDATMSALTAVVKRWPAEEFMFLRTQQSKPALVGA